MGPPARAFPPGRRLKENRAAKSPNKEKTKTRPPRRNFHDLRRTHHPGPQEGRTVPGAAGGPAGCLPPGGEQVGEQPGKPGRGICGRAVPDLRGVLRLAAAGGGGGPGGAPRPVRELRGHRHRPGPVLPPVRTPPPEGGGGHLLPGAGGPPQKSHRRLRRAGVAVQTALVRLGVPRLPPLPGGAGGAAVPRPRSWRRCCSAPPSLSCGGCPPSGPRRPWPPSGRRGWRRSTGTATAARRRSWCRSPRCRPSPSPARSPAGLPCPSGPRWGRCFWGCWPPCWCSPCFEAGGRKPPKFLANGAGSLYTVLK